MRPSRRELLGGALALAACGGAPAPDPRARGAAWLAAQQAADGGFHSVTYGFMRGGASLTGIALQALGGWPGRDRALDFLRASAVPDPNHPDEAALGFVGGIPDYPVYATALAISAFAAAKPAGWQDTVRPWARWLVGQQRGAGWEGHPAHGGFGMGGWVRPTPPNAGHVDLSMTRRAAEALAALGEDAPLALARRFAEGCRTPDGGFVYSYEEAVNKGETPRTGYGSATADGVLALLATGADPGAAPDVLRGMWRPDENPGMGGPFADYGRAMRFYWRAAAGAAFAKVGGPPGWADALRAALTAEQRPDGAWANEAALQKEDDPLIATSLALIAWDACRT